MWQKLISLFLFSSDAGPSNKPLEASYDMGSTEILQKGSTENLSNGTNSNLQAAKRLAKRLYQLDGFRRSDVAKHLGKKYVVKLDLKLTNNKLY